MLESGRPATSVPGHSIEALRFGLMTNGAPLERWQQSVLDRLALRNEVRADCWLLAGDATSPIDPFAHARRNGSHPGDATSAPPMLRVDCSGNSQDVLARELDFILSFVPPEAGRPLAHAALWGVWQFFFGDWVRYAGESRGFWEIHDDVTVACALLAQLQEDPAAVRVLKAGAVRAHEFRPAATLRDLQARCAHWPLQVCLELLDGLTDCLASEPVCALGRPRSRRGLATRIRFVLNAGVRALRGPLRQVVRHEQWNVGVIDAPIESLLASPDPPEPRWLGHLKRHEFLADPFGLMREGRLVVFCEYMNYRHGIGRIVALGGATPEQAANVEIGPPVHLSYPYLIEHEGRLYCIPETCQAKEVALYELERFPDRWRRVATIVDGLPLIDATAFLHEKRWWLAASLPVARGANCELHLYSADSLHGPWRAHPANPVKVDVASARPGGTPFWKDGALYRPAQDCSATYGGRIVINRVGCLTEQSFREECCATVEPRGFARYRHGLHTISAAGQVTVVDAKREIFVPAQGWLVVRYTLAKLGRRIGKRK
jgi:hypothetical protein